MAQSSDASGELEASMASLSVAPGRRRRSVLYSRPSAAVNASSGGSALSPSNGPPLRSKSHLSTGLAAHRNHEDAFGTDGATEAVSRKLAIFEVSDKYSKAERDADPALHATAFDLFKSEKRRYTRSDESQYS